MLVPTADGAREVPDRRTAIRRLQAGIPAESLCKVRRHKAA